MASNYFTPNVVMTILGVLAICALLYRYRKSVEGFEGAITQVQSALNGQISSATQTSMIPSDVAGATSSNPTIAKPQAKDVQATMELLENFMLLAASKKPESTNMVPDMKSRASLIKKEYANWKSQLQKTLSKPDTSTYTSKSLSDLRKQIETATHALRVASVVSATMATVAVPAKPVPATVAKPVPVPALDVKPTVVAGIPGRITLKELHELKERVQQEMLRLANLRSSSPTLTNRVAHLEALSADLGDIITAVERGKLNVEDVPIKPDGAQAFLKQLPNMGVALPSLIVPHGKTEKKMLAPPSTSVVSSNPALQQLLQNAQYLKWNVQLNLEFNPELAQKGRLVDRLEDMEKRLTNLAISETPLPKEMYDIYKQELKTIQAIMKGSSKHNEGSPRIDLPNTVSTRLEAPFPTADYPSSAQLSVAQGGSMGTAKGQFPNGEVSPDVFIRPGVLMNDDTIARRASASAFDPSTVGGPDYKKRSQELCNQVQSAQLGDPANFGCIKNPSEVSSEYSWKGNYEMVCNRIGDTWGGWYPEMFGCPKYDPTAKFKGAMM